MTLHELSFTEDQNRKLQVAFRDHSSCPTEFLTDILQDICDGLEIQAVQQLECDIELFNTSEASLDEIIAEDTAAGAVVNSWIDELPSHNTDRAVYEVPLTERQKALIMSAAHDSPHVRRSVEYKAQQAVMKIINLIIEQSPESD